jgi:uncharacterized protein (DUF2235 family)
MSRKLAVLFDGTWNTIKDCTSVIRLSELIAVTGSDGSEQLPPYYDKGVGTHHALDRIIGGGYRNDPLPKLALAWLQQKAKAAGLGSKADVVVDDRARLRTSTIPTASSCSVCTNTSRAASATTAPSVAASARPWTTRCGSAGRRDRTTARRRSPASRRSSP